MKHVALQTSVIFALLACGTSVAGADSVAARCEAGKAQAVGKYAACLHKPEAKLAKAKGVCVSFPVGETCVSDVDCSPWHPDFDVCQKDRTDYDTTVGKCTATFQQRWAKLADKAIDRNGECPDSWQFIDVRDQVAADVEALVARSAYVLSGRPRFLTETGDGAIFDGETGLLWERKVRLDGAENPGDLHDADNEYAWAGTCDVGGSQCQPDAVSSSLCLELVEGNPQGCATCATGGCSVPGDGTTVWQWLAALRTASFAGRADWRLPKLDELVSILDFEERYPAVGREFHATECGTACGDVTNSACACTKNFIYWSASTLEAHPDGVSGVDFDYGHVWLEKKTGRLSLRAVRDGFY